MRSRAHTAAKVARAQGVIIGSAPGGGREQVLVQFA
eukprot:SAG11_NODE_4670_length_1813_cov_1.348308_1_plen_35_part_10